LLYHNTLTLCVCHTQ